MRYDFKGCGDVCANAENEINNKVTESDLENDLKIIAVHVFGEIVGEVSDEAAFDVESART